MNEETRFPTIKRLKEVMAAYGVDPANWPEDERTGLEKLLELERDRSPEIADALKDASRLDQVLDGLKENQPFDAQKNSRAVMAKIAAARVAPPADAMGVGSSSSTSIAAASQGLSGSLYAGRWQMAAMLTVTFLLGLYIGASQLADPAIEGLTAFSGPSDSSNVELTIFERTAPELFGEEL